MMPVVIALVLYVEVPAEQAMAAYRLHNSAAAAAVVADADDVVADNAAVVAVLHANIHYTATHE